MTIHIPTIFLIIIATAGTLTLSVGSVTRAKEHKELLLWTIGLALHTLVYVLFFLRGQAPEFISVLVANTALSASYSFFTAAIGEFLHRQIFKVVLVGPPLVLAIIFSFLMDDISARIIVSGLVFSSQCAWVLSFLMNRKRIVSGRGKYLVVAGLTVIIVVLSARILSVMIKPNDISSMLHQTPIQVATFFGAFMSLILMSNGFVLMIKERADEHILQMAMKDRLTGVWNRVRLEEEAPQEIARLERYGHPTSLLMVDLDHFKQVNDQYGHATGDLVLKEFCAVVQSCIRTTDILARWGGEEFVVLLPNSGFVNAAPLAERIRAAVEKHEFPYGLRVTASIGLAICQPSDSWSSWLDRADQALYRAKSTGRNRVEVENAPTEFDTSKTNIVQLVWRPAYESGNAVIDTQHRALLEHSNILLQAILDNREKSEISQLVDCLISDIEQHFKDEEAIFQKAGYSDCKHHIELHEKLIDRARRLSDHFFNGQVRDSELLHFIMYEMVTQHILIEDRKYFSML
ncbi:diguanylate cyclase [Vibrio diazotrophicus]|uniref:diguanylate cyclase n=1 Tax=Vibrio diazotrophicus TaxID=685 RepID=A0A2J8I500_VIBDI|nr:diguanylate cyclase [Vibrio diazotrophicus]PNI05607.1 diguanylate cyclase [Vibrio diazotrophicus]